MADTFTYTAVQEGLLGLKTKCPHKHRNERVAIVCGNTLFGEGKFTIVSKMVYKPKSRAVRFSEALAMIGTLDDQISDINSFISDIEDFNNDPRDAESPQLPDTSLVSKIIDEALGAKAEIESLHEEMESWAENLEGGNMSHIPKYDEVTECRDQLQELIDLFDNLENDVPEAPTTHDVDAWQEYVDALEEVNSALNDLQNGDASFPGMY